MKRPRVRLNVDAYDLATALGLGMLFAGLWLVAPSLALGVVGGLLLVFGMFGALLKGAAAARGSRR